MGRAGPAARPSSSKLHLMGRGPARSIHFFGGWGAARPCPSFFYFSRPGPVRPMTFSNLPARPGPAHDIGSEAYETRAIFGPTLRSAGRVTGLPMWCPVPKRCTPMHRGIFSLFFVIVSFWILQASCFWPTRYNKHYKLLLTTQLFSTNGRVRWLPSRLVGHLLLLLRRPQQHQQHYYLLLPHLLPQYPLLEHMLSIRHSKGAKITPVMLSAGGSHAICTAAVLLPGSTTKYTKVHVAATFGRNMSPVWANLKKPSPAVPFGPT